MNDKTPQKTDFNLKCGIGNFKASPIILESPLGTLTQRNLTGPDRVAQDIVGEVYNIIQGKWNKCHIQGLNICQQITNLKQANQTNKYPDGLENLCFELNDLVTELETVKNTLELLNSRMSALSLQTATFTESSTILNITAATKLVNLVVEAYKDEYKMKEYVKRRIAHVELNNVRFLSLAWTYQTNIIQKHIDTKLNCLILLVGLKEV